MRAERMFEAVVEQPAHIDRALDLLWLVLGIAVVSAALVLSKGKSAP
jgi:hypothetical protein